MSHARRIAPVPVALLVAAALVACDGAASTETPDTGTVTVEIDAAVAPGVREVIWDLAVTDDGTPPAVWAIRVGTSRYGDGAGLLGYTGPCRAGTRGTVVATLVGVYDAPVADWLRAGDPAPAGALEVSVDVPPITRAFDCAGGQDTFVALEATTVAPAAPLLDGPAVVLDQWLCAPTLDCAADADRATLTLGLTCAVPAGSYLRPDLVLQNVALDCDGETVATIDPTRSDTLADVDVRSARDRVTLPGGDAARWSVAVDVPEARLTAGECHLRAAGTACYHDPWGTSHGSFSGCLGGIILAGVVRPYVVWDATVSRDGDLRCWNRDLGTDGLATALTAYDAAEDLTFPHLYWAWD
ncbi:MAG: hypothetical protein EP329_00085 [Deltaproteobacteria bacterium]|nr:MAG: hypothetical protein EP329_00085 [Deltaproteobacteria bacterium]